uniref:ATP-dependent RNA helicase n=1 Tax=Parastrongyloides trichosuri TaxID=131310 RepID=A0A0N4ZJC9_PARTI
MVNLGGHIYYSFKNVGSQIKPIHRCDDDKFEEEISRRMENFGYGKLMDVQKYLVPAVIEKKYDILIDSPQRTGKTLGYVAGIANYLCKRNGGATFGRKRDPVAIILMKNEEKFKETIYYINHLAPGAKIIVLVGLRSIPSYLNIINQGCDIIVGTTARFSKLINKDYEHLLRRNILKAEFLVFDQFELLVEGHWSNYLDEIIGKSFSDFNSSQIRIFAATHLVCQDLINKMERYTVDQYVIMKFSKAIISQCRFRDSIINRYALSNAISRNDHSKPNLKSNCFNVTGIPKHVDCYVSKSTNNNGEKSENTRDKISALKSYFSPEVTLTVDQPLRLWDVDSTFEEELEFIKSLKRSNATNRQKIPYSTSDFSSQEEYQEMESIDDLVFNSDTYKYHEIGSFKIIKTIATREKEMYDKLFEILKKNYSKHPVLSVIVFLTMTGCKRMAKRMEEYGISARILTDDLKVSEVKDNVRHYLKNPSSILFIDGNYQSRILQQIHAHVVISDQTMENKETFKARIKLLGYINGKGGKYIRLHCKDVFFDEEKTLFI